MKKDNPPNGDGSSRKKRKAFHKDYSDYPTLPPPYILLEDDDIMALFKLSINTVRDMRKKGRIPFFKVGRRYKYRSELILKMLN